jgi:hypothetical protein
MRAPAVEPRSIVEISFARSPCCGYEEIEDFCPDLAMLSPRGRKIRDDHSARLSFFQRY